MATPKVGGTWRRADMPGRDLPVDGHRDYTILLHGGRYLAWMTDAPSGPEAPPRRVLINSYSSWTDDGGQTWSRPVAAPARTIVVPGGVSGPAYDDAGRLLLPDRDRMLVSADDGATWKARVVAFPSGVEIRGLFRARGVLLAVASN